RPEQSGAPGIPRMPVPHPLFVVSSLGQRSRAGYFFWTSSPALWLFPAASALASSSASSPSTASFASRAFFSTRPELAKRSVCWLYSRAAVLLSAPSLGWAPWLGSRCARGCCLGDRL